MIYTAGVKLRFTKITLVVFLFPLFSPLSASKCQGERPSLITLKPSSVLLANTSQENNGDENRKKETEQEQTVKGHPSKQNHRTAIKVSVLRNRCGVNCLYLIMSLYKIDITYSELLLLLQPSHVGVSMLTLTNVAEQLGLETIAIEIQPEYILRFKNPIIALLMPQNEELSPINGHYVIMVPMAKKGGLWIFNPPDKKKWITKEQLVQEEVQNIPILILRPKIKTFSDLSNN